jgi:hypothetical protein
MTASATALRFRMMPSAASIGRWRSNGWEPGMRRSRMDGRDSVEKHATNGWVAERQTLIRPESRLVSWPDMPEQEAVADE